MPETALKIPPVRFYLAEQTRTSHELVDKRAEAFDLTLAEGVTQFLRFMYRGISAIEAGLDESHAARIFPLWSERKRAAMIGAELAETALAWSEDEVTQQALDFRSEAEVWGALYVLEGSRLGARILVNRSELMSKSDFFQETARCRYWPEFLVQLEQADMRLDDRAGMAEGACRAFAAFPG
ncbi:biliverdin-producing heme oxygenase [Roseibium polysiphoniae]|uniref:Biliverdin-producing heme oxygenase n=1 Tax=Roseibium polysiphoniae TaxID=2571221 RepID=A0ABR9C6T1_9HYPH|nr:biliverdin-producing heme oxygenase [Roseibium polysiphoniae]MBD8875607.1 biliverdin-producing heme oxygenase [Roseibium polysiphoniae]